MKKIIILFDVLIVMFVFVLGILISNMLSTNIDYPNSNTATEVNSPSNWLNEEDIRVYDDVVVLEIQNARFISLADTNSMDPVFDNEANIIEIIPETAYEINIGDIISFEAKDGRTYIHRVIIKDIDNQGYFFITKGDNNQNTDSTKIRFSQVKGVVVGILY
jgi:signal peptidase I